MAPLSYARGHSFFIFFLGSKPLCKHGSSLKGRCQPNVAIIQKVFRDMDSREIPVHLLTPSPSDEDYGLSLLIGHVIIEMLMRMVMIPKSQNIPTILITIMTMTSGCRSWLIGKLRKAGLSHDSQDITLSAFP